MKDKNNFEDIVKRSEDINLLTEIQKIVYDDTQDMGIHQNNFLNIAYYAGRQWLVADKDTNMIIEAPKDSNKIRLTVNRIAPVVRANLGKMTKNKPIMNVIPASDEESDAKAAKTADKILEYLEDSLKLQSIDRETILWGITTSIVWIKAFWNTGKGEYIKNTKIRQGDCDIDVANRFEIKYDKTAKNWKDVRWIQHEKLRTVDYVKSKYPETAKDISADADLSTKNVYEVRLQNLGKDISFGENRLHDMVRVKEYWEKPSAKYPKGRRVTYVDGTILFKSEDIGFGEADDSERQLPFFPFTFIDLPGLVEGRSCVDDLREIQKEYNIARSQLINNKNKMAGSRWLIEEGSLASGEITNDPDEIIEYRKGFNKPDQVPTTSISSDVVRDIDSLIEEFYFISGQNDISHGNTNNSKVKSGIAIQYLEEQDDTKLGPTVKNWLDCKREYEKYLLKMVKYKYTEQRTIKVVGENHEIETFEFQGSDLTSYDVRVQEGSMLQESRTAKEERIFGLINAGVLNVERDRELILKMLDLGTTDYLYNENALDANMANLEQYKWRKGDITNTPTFDYYNHELHIIEHNKFRKLKEYQQLPDNIKKYIEEHIKEHVNWLVHGNPEGVPIGSSAGDSVNNPTVNPMENAISDVPLDNTNSI